MNLRIRIIIAIAAVTAGMMIAFYLFTRSLVWGIFASLEEESARVGIGQLSLAVGEEISGLERVAADYAHWDETYRYVGDQHAGYLESSLNADAFANNDLDNVVIFDWGGRVVYEASYNPQTENVVPRAVSLVNYIRTLETQRVITYLTRPTDPNASVSGLILLPEGPMMIAMQPILPSSGAGVITGSMVMGRYLDSIEEQRLSEKLHLPVSFVVLNNAPLPEDLNQINQAITLENPLYFVSDYERVLGFTPLFDIVDRRILLARVDVNRVAHFQNFESQRSLFLMLVISGSVMIIVMIGIVFGVGLRSMVNLQREIKTLRQKSTLSHRIQAAGRDEYANLVSELNELLNDFEQASHDAELGRSTQKVLTQAQAVRQVTQAVNSTLSTEKIIRNLVAELGDRFGYYYVGIFLLDEQKLNAILYAGTGNVVPEGYQLTVGGSSTVGMCIVRKEIQTSEIGNRKEQISFTRLPMARSEAAAPIRFANDVLGAIAIQSTQPDVFKNQEELDILQYLADYAGGILTTARLMENLQGNYVNLEKHYQQFLVERWNEELRMQGRLSYTFQQRSEDKNKRQTHRSELPLMLNGVGIGQVEIDLMGGDSSDHGLSPESREMVTAILAQTAQALENARLLERSRRRATQERLVAEIVRSARTSTNVDTILGVTVLELGRLLRASSAELRIQPNASTILLEQIDQEQVLAAESGNGSAGSVNDSMIADREVAGTNTQSGMEEVTK